MRNDSLALKHVTLQNRIVAAPIVTNSGDNNGRPTEKTLALYRGYAESGAGMVVMEQIAVHPWGRNNMSQFRLYDDDAAASLAPVTALFRERGVPFVAQLNFAGAGASGRPLLDEADFQLVSPSGLRTPRDMIKEDSRALTKSEIHEIVQSFADAAHRAVSISKFNCGVQIYASHGYLLSQFLSPITNQRTDEYGGSPANRARIVFEAVEAVKGVIGEHPLSVRLGASDQMPGDPACGLTLDESVRIAEELANMGIDWLSVSGNHCIYGLTADDRDTAYFAPYSAAMRQAVSRYGVYVDCTGGIRTPETAERLLNEQVCDLIGIGRPLLTDKSYLKNWAL